VALSIITAVHNSLAMNRLYWETIVSHTTSPFELIVIDNHSTDGSERFFAELARRDARVVHVRNPRNRSYPESQIQGMDVARHEVLCFLNNDVWFPRGWNEPFERELARVPHGILSPSGEDAQPTLSGADRLKRRWKRANALSQLWRVVAFRSEYDRLHRSLEFMYGDLEDFHPPTPADHPVSMPGIKGDSVIFHRRLLERIPEPWDPKIQAADWHLYLLAAREHERDASFPLPRILFDTYVHHFGRYSARKRWEPLDPPPRFVTIEDHWGKETVRRLWWAYQMPE
jgi:glycosyltransferase involved in cell wall biosynthesis